MSMTMVVTISVTIIAIAMMVVFISFAIARGINVVVPIIAYEIDRPAAGIISTAVVFPFLSLAGWHSQIHWLLYYTYRYRLNQNRLTIYDLWLGKIANVDMPIKAGLSDRNRDANVGRHGWCRHCGRKTACRNQK
jgi:hypothetical protein